MKYDSLIKAIKENKDSDLIIRWDSGLKILGTPDTLFETDNGLDDDDANFVEYYAVAFKVDDIVEHPTDKSSSIYNWLIHEKGNLVEISLYDDPPSEILLSNNQSVWNSENQ